MRPPRPRLNRLVHRMICGAMLPGLGAGRVGTSRVSPTARRRTRPSHWSRWVDISGSMSRYSRMFLHFLHAITAGRDAHNLRVHSFLFGNAG